MKTIKIQYILTLSFVIMSVLCFGQQKDDENSTDSNNQEPRGKPTRYVPIVREENTFKNSRQASEN
jgi:hypothetical protein